MSKKSKFINYFNDNIHKLSEKDVSYMKFQSIEELVHNSKNSKNAIGEFINDITPVTKKMEFFNTNNITNKMFSENFKHKSLLISLQIMFWLINYFYYIGRDKPYSFCIAKGFGLNLRVITMFLFMSMCKNLIGKCIQLTESNFFSNILNHHTFMGYCMTLHTIGHTISHVIHGISIYSFYTITGCALILILFIITFFSILRKMSSKNYFLFSISHTLYIPFVFFLIMHVNNIWLFFLIPICIFFIEKLYDFFYRTTWFTLVNCRINENIVFLTIPRNHATIPGSYYKICVPSINLEWHPYSIISNSNSNHLTFFIGKNGDWSTRLLNMVSSNNPTNYLLVQGPFVSPACNLLNDDSSKLLFISTGIGITPLFSILAERNANVRNQIEDFRIFSDMFDCKFQKRDFSLTTMEMAKEGEINPYESCDISKLEPIRIVWILRDAYQLLFYMKYLSQISDNVIIQVYITSFKDNSIENNLRKYIFLLLLDKKEGMTIHFKRPRIDIILDHVEYDKLFYCGNSFIRELIELKNSKQLICENFD